ncbi:biotin/lipoyl-containing protein [Escherichia coli]
MSSVDILVPDLPESVADATVATWHKKPGDAVVRDEVLVEIETLKAAALEVPASGDGILDARSWEDEGTTVTSRQILGRWRVKATAPVKKPAPNLKRKRPLRRNASRRLWKSKTTMR